MAPIEDQRDQRHSGGRAGEPVEVKAMNKLVLSVERTMAAPPEVIFPWVADATKHSRFDGSGAVQGAKPDTPQHLELGTRFGMDMKMGLRYSTVNRVIEFEPNRRIAWKTGPEGRWGNILAGRVWRYELEPVSGGTLVRESWDLTTDHQRALLKLGDFVWNKTRRNMEATLERLEVLTAGEANGGEADA
jgi:uncharacterized protein YndB with AHSA1/START domain